MSNAPPGMTRTLAARVGQGAIALMILFIAYWPGGFAAVLLSRAFHGGEAAPAYVVLAALFVLMINAWKDRIYVWFAKSSTAEHMRL